MKPLLFMPGHDTSLLPADWYLSTFHPHAILTEILRFAQDDSGRREGIMDNLGHGMAP